MFCKCNKLITLCVIIAALACFVTLCGCTNSSSYVEQEHLYWKTIEVEVTDIDFRHWYASGHHYTADVTVYSEEYNLTESFHLTNNSAMKMEGVRRGDILEATLYSWKYDSTGEITRRCISSIQ